MRHKLSDQGLLSSFFKLVLIVFLLFFVGSVVTFLFTDQAHLSSFVSSAGAWGPLLIIGFIILEVVLAPVPGTFIMVAAGALYGTWLGALYSYAGNVLGSLLAFFLAQRFGRPFVERIISHSNLRRYDRFFKDNRHWVLLFYMLPVIPVDILSFTCGLSSLRWRRFLTVIMVGFIPNTLILAFLGEQLAGLSLVAMVFYTLLFLLVFSLLSWLFRLLVKRHKQRRMEKDI